MAQLIPFITDMMRAMIFVDGENFSIRYGNMLKQRGVGPKPHITYVPSILLWSSELNHRQGGAGVVRKHFYTSVQGS